jgi:methylenetetrahydrofolate reductase (NADPH)
MEAEVMGQFYKLRKKIEAGADFVITQVGYDARKLQELRMWLKSLQRHIPALASVYVLSYPVAKACTGTISRVVVTEKLLRRMAVESGKQGQTSRLTEQRKCPQLSKGRLKERISAAKPCLRQCGIHRYQRE